MTKGNTRAGSGTNLRIAGRATTGAASRATTAIQRRSAPTGDDAGQRGHDRPNLPDE